MPLRRPLLGCKPLHYLWYLVVPHGFHGLPGLIACPIAPAAQMEPEPPERWHGRETWNNTIGKETMENLRVPAGGHNDYDALPQNCHLLSQIFGPSSLAHRVAENGC